MFLKKTKNNVNDYYHEETISSCL